MTYHNNDQIGAVTSFAQKKPANDGISTNLDSVLGLQLDWQLLQNTAATIQGLARKGDSMQPELRMGYLRQQLWNNVSIRIGRIRSPFFFDSDVAEIGYASMTVMQTLLSQYFTRNTYP